MTSISLALLLALLHGPVTLGPHPPATEPVTEEASEGEADAAATEAGPKGLFADELQVLSRADQLIGVADSATAGFVAAPQLENRPILRAGDLLETIPGLISTQHSGAGKANQLFLRGFNLDHGTDFRTSLIGVPLNLASHGHGQGYTDLNLLIPELVASVEFKKGPYYVEEGDFSAAGAARIEYVNELERPLVAASAGELGYRRLLVGASRPVGSLLILGAAEVQSNDGPWEHPEDLRKANAVFRLSRQGEGTDLTLTALGYTSEWQATDQIPSRAVTSGQVSRYGTIDETDGGETSRLIVSTAWRRVTDSSLSRLGAYGLYYDLELFSNFTYFLDDPIRGDQFSQTDQRTAFGVDGSNHSHLVIGGLPVEWKVGFEARHDEIENSLLLTQARRLVDRVRADEVAQTQASVFGETRTRWNSWLRSVVGVRLDWLGVDVRSDRDDNSGRENAFLVSPKVGLVASPSRSAELYFNAGYGFHSNDARGATTTVDPRSGQAVRPGDLLVRAKGVDVGVRLEAFRNLRSTVAVFQLDIDSELVFLGDAGTTDASRPSRRRGIEWANFLQLGSKFSLEADVTVSQAKFRDDSPEGREVPGSVERTASLALTLAPWRGWSGGIRWRYLGSRPLVEDDSVRSRSSSWVHAGLGYTTGRGVRLLLEVFNALDDPASDIEYFYASRLPDEGPGGVEGVHFHPSEPRTFRLSLIYGLGAE